MAAYFGHCVLLAGRRKVGARSDRCDVGRCRSGRRRVARSAQRDFDILGRSLLLFPGLFAVVLKSIHCAVLLTALLDNEIAVTGCS